MRALTYLPDWTLTFIIYNITWILCITIIFISSKQTIPMCSLTFKAGLLSLRFLSSDQRWWWSGLHGGQNQLLRLQKIQNTCVHAHHCQSWQSDFNCSQWVMILAIDDSCTSADYRSWLLVMFKTPCWKGTFLHPYRLIVITPVSVRQRYLG